MGLIKLAMLAGAGMYAVDKYTQSRRKRHLPQDSNHHTRNPQQYIDNGVPNQHHYYTEAKLGGQQQQQQQKVIPLEFTHRRNQQPHRQQGAQPQYLLTNDSNVPVPVPSYRYDLNDGSAHHFLNPITMVKGRAQGFVEADEIVSESELGGTKNRRGASGSGSTAFLDTLVQNCG
ncbi:hypothetical protein G647_07985 [Cladophialophora carrionii CBS 160.54]|uniref:Uncharacterized protein n=1 Tax=Cladophialophora carrionii CBS 160.54 TaxID=1279043 RepID=V9D5R5_9EURO|nr:uncharacterized protein G647_07985 [Cladophialophora carrionii CBS 160.54]ETI21638.1 hypothetical protein G647_07985 [Cladophialophora carrionii CBS 160.54]